MSTRLRVEAGVVDTTRPTAVAIADSVTNTATITVTPAMVRHERSRACHRPFQAREENRNGPILNLRGRDERSSRPPPVVLSLEGRHNGAVGGLRAVHLPWAEAPAHSRTAAERLVLNDLSIAQVNDARPDRSHPWVVRDDDEGQPEIAIELAHDVHDRA